MVVVLALVSAVGWGVADFLGGSRSRTLGVLPVLLVSQLTALVLVAGLAITAGGGPPQLGYLAAAAGAGVSELIGIAALYRGLAVGRASVVAPVAAAAPVVPLLVGIALGQVPGPLQLAGLALVVAGIVLTAHQRRTGGATGAALLHGLLSAAGFGAFFVLMDVAGDGGVPWALLVARTTAVALLAGAVLVVGVPVRPRRQDVPVLALVGALIVLADAGYTAAATIGHVGIAAVVAALHPVVTIGLAAACTRERTDLVQRTGVGAAVLGIVLVTAV